jgi:LytS/YehU family sensor histidine kinase
LLYPVISGIVTVHIVDRYIDSGMTQFKLANHISTIIILILGIVPLASVKIARRLIYDSNVKRELEKKKVEAELKFKEAELKLLKAQIHPHFLFNTLNNLYSLAIEKSDKTPEVIIKISDMLSYIIYDCNAEKVSLEKEVEFINSYIALEKLRYDENLNITVSISGNLTNKFVAPMILHAFIENSFKHGASNDVGSPWITLNLKITGDKLNFTIANSKVIPNENKPAGIGIENVKKRLQLLYPGRHHLNISDSEGVFLVKLDIDL